LRTEKMPRGTFRVCENCGEEGFVVAVKPKGDLRVHNFDSWACFREWKDKRGGI